MNDEALRAAAKQCAFFAQLEIDEHDHEERMTRPHFLWSWSKNLREESEWHATTAAAYRRLESGCRRAAERQPLNATHVKKLLTVERRLNACAEKAMYDWDYSVSCRGTLDEPEAPDPDL